LEILLRNIRCNVRAMKFATAQNCRAFSAKSVNKVNKKPRQGWQG
jgi:hypothetical protein